MKKIIQVIIGVTSGLLNGLFGSGGGVAAVPLLRISGVDVKKSHATSVAVIFILSIVSVVFYAINDNLDYAAAFRYIPYGVLGAVTGAALLNKIQDSLLRRIFGGLIIVSAVKILL